MRDRCGDCKHYDFGAAILNGEKQIRCVALPPQIVPLFGKEGVGYTSQHPVVRKESLCCGQFSLVAKDGVGPVEVPNG
jgi:hypothetical protein